MRPGPLLHVVSSLLLSLFAFAASAAADTVILKSGKKISGVTVSRHDSDFVVINPWNSRVAGMAWEIPAKNKIPAGDVAEVIIEDAPAVEMNRRALKPGVTADDLFALATYCGDHKKKVEAEYYLLRALLLDPGHQGALDAIGGEVKLKTLRRKTPSLDPEIVRAERAFLAADDDPLALKDGWTTLKSAKTKRALEEYLRARRSAKIQKGRRDKVPMSFNTDEASGATYCVYVPENYDPLTPTPLVIGLHGGGAGGKDDTLVTGSGESAMNWYVDQARRWGWLVACPTALKAPWRNKANEPVILGLLDEMKTLYNVDVDRLYLAGHSMGGFGSWHWGPQLQKDVWAAFAPCAGGGGPNGVKIPVYIYHGSDDTVCPVSRDRSAAKALGGDGKKKSKVDFVYTELDGVGHGWPNSVRDDIWQWFAGRKRSVRSKSPAPRSSFDPKIWKVGKQEKAAFGDPSKLPKLSGPTGGDADAKELIALIRDGGGTGLQAAEKLGTMKDAKTAKMVSAVLKHRSSTIDARVLATKALRLMAIPECIPHLEIAATDENFRIVDEAVLGFTAIKTAAVVPGLEKAGKRLGELWDASFFGDQITHTELKVRCASFGALVDAFTAVGVDGSGAALPLIDRVIVSRAYDPKKMYVCMGDTDYRFKNASSKARLALARRICACAEALGDAAAVPTLKRIPARWPAQTQMASVIEATLATLE